MLRQHPLSDPVYAVYPHYCKKRWLVGVAVLTLIILGILALICVFGPDAYSQTRLPGTDASDKLEAAGTLLRIIDTGLFKWGARIFAGICIMSSAWALKEQRFGIAIICIVGAIIFGTAPTWVKNIFDIGGGDSVFGYVPTFENSIINGEPETVQRGSPAYA